jgi:hypothetical protein
MLYSLRASNSQGYPLYVSRLLKQRSISFQSATPETVQNDMRFYAYRHLVALSLIIGLTRSTPGTDTRMHARTTRQRVSKSKGLPIDVPLSFYYFQQGAPDRRSIQLLLLLARETPRTKSKGLPINTPHSFYLSYAPSAAHKKQGAPHVCAPCLVLD